MKRMTVAICTYNRAERLQNLIEALRQQVCSIPFEILVVDNNSSDNTQIILASIGSTEGIPVRFVVEKRQGITFARNRAIQEAAHSQHLLFIDDDEWPLPGLVEAATQALEFDEAECVGGRIKCFFGNKSRPGWLRDDLLPFLGAVDYGSESFWVVDETTPLWSGNIAYRTAIFKENPHFRFDHRYNRRGEGIGGGSDAIMFQEFLKAGVKMRYRPDMVLLHSIEESRLNRGYFLKRHFISGQKYGQFQTGDYPRTIAGIPFFMFSQMMRQCLSTFKLLVARDPRVMRQAMNASYAMGSMYGRFLGWCWVPRRGRYNCVS